ncbi:Uncharacterised protein [Vibrio cholerae]|nr:Uncharacterised protein [Vibrio cholerae]
MANGWCGHRNLYASSRHGASHVPVQEKIHQTRTRSR